MKMKKQLDNIVTSLNHSDHSHIMKAFGHVIPEFRHASPKQMGWRHIFRPRRLLGHREAAFAVVGEDAGGSPEVSAPGTHR